MTTPTSAEITDGLKVRVLSPSTITVCVAAAAAAAAAAIATLGAVEVLK